MYGLRNHFCDYGKHISIGKNVLIGPGTGIYTATHPTNYKERLNLNKEGQAPYKTYALPVKIGDNVWIGGNVSIMPGVTIGDNSVIGDGSVVKKSLPNNVVAAGNPCKIIKILD